LAYLGNAKEAGVATGAKKGQRGKRIEDVVGYAISKRTRCQILIVLNQGAYCAKELSEIIDEPINTVSNYLNELAEGGVIEIAETKKHRNFDQHFYRAIETPTYSEEDLIEMHPFERQVTVALVVQSLLAEIMASLWARKLGDDPNHCFIWTRHNLDAQGRTDTTKEQERHWAKLNEIAKESEGRSDAKLKEIAKESKGLSDEKLKEIAKETGAATVPYIVAALGFLRERKAPVAGA
jgi:DNA-binding transcriptional ArsR family regulator